MILLLDFLCLGDEDFAYKLFTVPLLEFVSDHLAYYEPPLGSSPEDALRFIKGKVTIAQDWNLG